jgi:type II secretory pathway predicted ATPase ExeA
MSPSGVSTPDVVDLRAEGARPIEAFGEDPTDPGTDRGPAPAPGEGTLTYERHYGLREKPFSLSTDPRFLYRSGSRGPVLHDLAAAIRRREGLIVLTGDIGLGKTTLCRAVLSQLDRKTFATFVPDPFVTREDLLKTMLIDFGAMSVEDLVKGRLKGATRPDLSYPLYEFLQSLEPLDAFAVLVLDEVQNLSLPLLEEIRILSDLEHAGRKLLQVVLVGQPEFDEHLKLPRMRQIKQRVSVHCELGPLARDEVAGYVTHRLRVAGAAQEHVRLTDEALDLVRAASGGVPRVINLICDRALAQGHMARTARIGADLVLAGLAGLRIPIPVLEPVPAAPAQTPIAPAPAQAAPLETPVAPVQAPVAQVPVAELAPVVTVVPLPPKAVTIQEPAGESKGLFEAKGGGNGYAAPAQDLSSLLDLPAVDLKVTFEEGPQRRPTRTPPVPAAFVTRGKVWSGTRGLRPVAAGALAVIGLTTGVSLVGYWFWIRPLWGAPVDLPSVSRPAVVQTTVGPQASRPSSSASPATAVTDPVEPRTASAQAPPPSGTPAPVERWVIQAGVFSTPERAATVVEQLIALGYPAFEQKFTRGTLRVAFAGPFNTKQEADAALAALRRQPGFEDVMLSPRTR